jgi:Tol biopolymer transport system component
MKLKRRSAETVQERFERELRAAEARQGTGLEGGPAGDASTPSTVQRVRPVFLVVLVAVAGVSLRAALREHQTAPPAPPRAAPIQPAYYPEVGLVYQRPGGGQGPGALIDMPSRSGVFLVGASGGPPRQLTPIGGIGASPAWRPDGKALAVVWNAQLVEVGVDHGEPVWKKPRTLTPPQGLFSPTYAPDGAQLAFVSARSIWTVRRGSPPKQLTHDGPNYYFVDWAPRGNTLVAMRNGLTTIVSPQSKPNRTVPTGRYGWDPRWAPDGTHIAVTSLDGGAGPHVFITDSSATYFNEFSARGALTQYASWSRDGKKIVYAKFDQGEGQWDLFVYDFGTKHERRLTHTPVDETTPVWSPNGQFIAYARTSSF